MKLIDNINTAVGNDLKENIKKGSKISMAAACFSIYAYQKLKKELERVEELRFIFYISDFYKRKSIESQERILYSSYQPRKKSLCRIRRIERIL